ncbi:antirestriction protein, partial [Escherichia coli]
YTLNNGGAFMAPEPDDDDDETWVLFNAMNGNRAEMSPEAAGIGKRQRSTVLTLIYW